MIDSVSKILEDAISQRLVPGVQFAIVRGYDIESKSLGFKRLFPVEEVIHGDEIYDVASLTKVIVTTTLVMKLIDDKKITLDTPLSDLLSAFKHRDITIYDLMTHSSGLPADIPRASRLKSRQEVLDHVFSVQPIYEKGTHIVYSDIGFILLGLLVESLYGSTLHDIATDIIFKPLQMHDTGYRPIKSRCAPTEYRDDDVYQGYLEGNVHDEKAYAMGGISGHAGLFSTATDIARFIRSILLNQFVLNKDTTDLLFKAQVRKNSLQGTPLIRALGWDKPTPGGSAGDGVDFEQTILHTGFTGCNMWIDRKHQIGFVLLSNDVHPTRAQKGILALRPMIGNILLSKEEETHR